MNNPSNQQIYEGAKESQGDILLLLIGIIFRLQSNRVMCEEGGNQANPNGQRNVQRGKPEERNHEPQPKLRQNEAIDDGRECDNQEDADGSTQHNLNQTEQRCDYIHGLSPMFSLLLQIPIGKSIRFQKLLEGQCPSVW